jgi:hypothetical protein
MFVISPDSFLGGTDTGLVFHPFKAVYVTTNPVSVPPRKESGEITNILYENLRIWHPIWWGIYIGPQQQKQPTGEGPGCMTYPLNKHCDTDPLVPMTNITLRNVTSTGGLLPAGIIRCNSTRPCTGFHFEDVNVSQPFWDLIGKGGYITEYIEGTAIRSTPDPKFKPLGYYNDPKNRRNDETVDEIEAQFTTAALLMRAAMIITDYANFNF